MAGELVIRKGGFLGIEDSSDEDLAEERGKGQVFADDPEDCCCCDPCENADPKPHKIIASWTARSDYPAKDLRPYKKKGLCFKRWKIAEGGMRWSDEGRYEGANGSGYEGGAIENGELIGLPDEWESSYSYEGYMDLAIYCDD